VLTIQEAFMKEHEDLNTTTRKSDDLLKIVFSKEEKSESIVLKKEA